jgi:glycosyltransferase involved in cell wall biosynthesis
VDRFIANSQYVARRIRKVYGRDSTVIYPPVDVDRFGVAADRDDYYVTAARLVPYKRVDLIVEAFSAMPHRRLVVIGDGPDLKRIAARVTGNIELLGRVPFEVLRDHLQRARAFIFAAEEDFGIFPVEAQACGTPVIAYGEGGARETVVPVRERTGGRPVRDEQATGVLFHEQTVPALASAVALFEQHEREFDVHAIRRHALKFSRERFRAEFRQYIDSAVVEHFRARC